MNKTTALQFFRRIALLEGISYISLMAIAMPLKYLVGITWPVKYLGWSHGILFVLYCILLLQIAYNYKLSLLKIGVAFVAALLPFGTFILDAKLLKQLEYQVKNKS